MRGLVKAYDGLVVGLACIAGALPLFILTAVVLNVASRALDLQPPLWTQAYSEFSLLFCAMLSAPWLVHVRGHVFVEAFLIRFPGPIRRVAEKAVYTLCIIVALIVFYYSLDKFIVSLSSGEYEARSVDVPLWVEFSSMPVSFLLIAIEFARYLFGRESMYGGTAPASTY